MLCVAVMLSVMVVGAGAAFSDQSKIKNTEAVDMCVALNIIGGYGDNTYRPENNITRAEVCKMICVALNGGKEPTLSVPATPTFKDVRNDANSAWAEKYIESCVAQGIVGGVGNGNFEPSQNVTGSQLAKMLLVALGYKSEIEGFGGNGWDTQVNVVATQKGLYEDLENIDVSAALTRDSAAQMIWNALKAVEVEYKYTLDGSNGQLTSKADVVNKTHSVNGTDVETTLLYDKYGVVDDQSAQMIDFKYNSDKEEWTYTFNNKSTVAGGNTDGNLKYTSFTSSNDYTDLFMQNVKVIYTEKNGKVDTVYGMYADDSVVLASALVGDFDDVGTNDKEVTISDVDYDLEKAASNINVYTFENATGSNESATLNAAVAQANYAFEIEAIDYDDNGDIDFFVMHKFEVKQIASIGSKNFTLEKATAAGNISFKFEDVVTYDGMAEDDFVVYTPAAYSVTGDDTFAKVDTVLKGDITAYKNAGEFAVDGTWYKTVADIDGANSGSSIKDAPVVNGYIFEGSTTGTADVEDYAMIVSIVSDNNNGINGAQAKLLFSDGTKKVVDLDKDYNMQAGWFVTYDVNSDGEYALTVAISDQDNNDKQQTGFDQVNKSSTFKDGDLSSSNKIKYLNGWNISDDAVIFVNDNGDYKVITGAQLKSTSGANVSQIIAYANDNSDTGYQTVEMAKIVFKADSVSADNTYGFVTADPITIQNADDKSVTKLVIWTEDGKEVELNTKDGVNTDGIKKGSIISYSVNEKNEIDTVKVETTVGSTSGMANSNVTKYVSAYDGTYVVLNGDGNRHEITKDTVIVYINADKSAGSDNGAIKQATKTGAADGAKYYNNVYVIFDGDAADADVDTIFVDINNDIDDLM